MRVFFWFVLMTGFGFFVSRLCVGIGIGVGMKGKVCVVWVGLGEFDLSRLDLRFSNWYTCERMDWFDCDTKFDYYYGWVGWLGFGC